jgi:enoyl-[acyl-carrier protein] reductase I
MGFLQGKRALITGIASQRSIASGIAEAMHRQGAELALTYQTDKLRSRVEDAAKEYGSNIVLPLDVASDEQIATCFTELGKHWGDGFDILVHCIAYAPREAIGGDFLDGLTRENFAIAQDISTYSLAALAKAARQQMKGRNGAILTLSYLGSIRALQNYNVMGVAKAALEASVRYLAADLGPHGIRVNAISAGPIRTLAASGIAGFRTMYGKFKDVAPLRRNVSIEDVGATAVYLASDLSAGVTGETLYVDAGFNILGVPTGEA